VERTRQRKAASPDDARAARSGAAACAREPGWGYQRIAGELLKLGFRISPSTVRRLLASAGSSAASPSHGELAGVSAPSRASLLACDFFMVETVTRGRLYVLVFIELGRRRVHFAGCTTNPSEPGSFSRRANLGFTDVLRADAFLIQRSHSSSPPPFDEVFRKRPALQRERPHRGLRNLLTRTARDQASPAAMSTASAALVHEVLQSCSLSETQFAPFRVG